MLLNTQRAGTIVIPRTRSSWPSRFAFLACSAYLLAILAATALLWTVSEQWWPATVLLFAPRWVLALPLALLVPIAAIFHRKSLLILGAASLVLLVGVLGYCFSLSDHSTSKPDSGIRLLSYNIHRSQLDAAAFRTLIEATEPDIVALQDWSSVHEEILFGDSGWYTQRDGELFVASRFPILRTTQLINPPTLQPEFKVRYGTAVAYELLMPTGPLTVVNLHLASPHEALQAMRDGDESFSEQLAFNSQQRDAEATTVSAFVERAAGPIVIAGDFNTPRESPLFRRNFGGLANAFSEKGSGFGLTHVSLTSSVRIDHVLASGWNVRNCWIADAAGSPHRPMVTDLQPDLTAGLKVVQGEP